MNRPLFLKVVLVICLACLPCTGRVSASAPVRNGGGDPPASGSDAPDSDAKRFVQILVNGRTLTGPNSSAQQIGGRTLIPIVSVARALGDVVNAVPAARTISVKRQTGIAADFDARLGQVRENGSLVLTISNTAEIVFSPNVNELMLPAEIAAALLDVAVRYDADKNTVLISRGLVETISTQSTGGRRPFEIYQADYEYSLDRYLSASLQNLSLKLAGRLGDGRFTFLSNSTAASLRNFSPFQTGTFNLERPNGQRFSAGDFGTGTDLQFLSAAIRGGSASIPVGKMMVTGFGGRSFSGVFLPIVDPLLQPQSPSQPQPQQKQINRFHFDTNVFGVLAASDSAANGRGSNPFGFSTGAMHFDGPQRSGDLVSGSLNYNKARFQLQGEFGFGKFAGLRPDNSPFSGSGAAVDLSGTFQLTDQIAVQGRYTNIGENFLSPQSGLREPVVLKAASISWSPKKWISTSFNASTANRPGVTGQESKYITAAISITPRPRLPQFYLTHTESRTSQTGSASFTMLTVSKEFSRLRTFVNASRIKSLGPAVMNAQVGANYSINDANSLEFSQGIATTGALNGQFDWQTSSLWNGRLNFSAGAGYNYDKISRFSTFERVSASVKLPRQTVLQVNYLQTSTGPTLLVNVRGTLFRKRSNTAFLDSPVAEMNSYGKVSGRVYQDVDLNGRFDPGIDKPQAEVKVQVDGNRYVMSDENGMYSIDDIPTGDHRVYLDLLSVRADLTFLDAETKNVNLQSGRASVSDFRLVRTGRISGRVWLDANENGKLDEGETLLVDVRVVTASGRDTLTDNDGYFSIGDLPPGDHVVLIDEKTLPEKTMAELKPVAIRTLPGLETADIRLPVTMIPAEVKRFGTRAAK
ncbi:MAG TPA: hypothetical protein VGO50_19070 [Pyrinomonadaceae bacterium]|jgi:hypothetical protein|nr:hypothetical protein [Pyrinomonadaceae bacterium]